MSWPSSGGPGGNTGRFDTDPNVHWNPATRRYYRYDPQTGQSTYIDALVFHPQASPENEEQSTLPGRYGSHLDEQYRRSGYGSDEATSALASAFQRFNVQDDDYVYVPSTSSLSAAVDRSDIIGEGTTAAEPDITGVEYNTAEQNIVPDLPNAGHRHRATVYGKNKQTLDPRFAKHSKKFFVPGRVIKILWPELASPDDRTNVTITSRRFHDGRIYEKIRWFVVVKAGHDSCICIPIATYEKKGVAKKGVLKRHHCIVHTSRRTPPELDGELPTKRNEKPMLSALQVIPSTDGDYMEDQSRLNFGKMYTVEYNVRVYDFGMVAPKHIPKLVDRWRRIILEPDAGQPQNTEDTDAVVHQYTQQPGTSTSHQRTLLANYPTFARPMPVETGPPEVPEQPDLPDSMYVDLGEAIVDYTPPANDTRQIALRARDRLSILEWPYDDWATAYNGRTRRTGWVALQYLHLYETAYAKYAYSNEANTRGFVTVEKGDELRLIEDRPDGWSLVWKKDTAETGLVPSNYIEKQI